MPYWWDAAEQPVKPNGFYPFCCSLPDFQGGTDA
jgi:hypothetical protein